MRYKDIKIIETKVVEQDVDDTGSEENDVIYNLVVTVDTTDELVGIKGVPRSYLKRNYDNIKEKISNMIGDKVPAPFKVLTITVVDPDGVEQPLEDLFPSIDGDKDANKDNFKVIGSVNFVSLRVLEYKRWLADEAQTEFKRDQRTNYFDKDRLKELTVKDDGEMAGALIDPKTGKAVGAIAGTPAAKKMDAYVQDNQNVDTIVGIVEIGSGSGSDSEGKDGKEGEDGEEGEPLAAGEVQDLVDEFYKGMHPTLFGLGDWTRADWWGTDEHIVLRALKKIKNRKQMQQVWNAYMEKHDENLSQEIMSEYFLSAKKHKGIDKIHVEQLNREFKRLGLYFRNEKLFRRIEKWGR